jgi:hypothetical protein
MFAELATVVKDAKTIVIARYHRPPDPFTATAYELLVERPLRGGVRPGAILRVAPSPDGHAAFADGTRVVAFVDAKSQWIAAATAAPGTGATLETSVLHIAGFFDENASLVSPSTVTLGQLVPFLTTGKPMTWTFTGPILVGTPHGFAPSALVVTAEVPSNRVAGIEAHGFPKPGVVVGAGMGSDAAIVWQQELSRPLVLDGVATGIAADGSITVAWTPEYPPLATEADLRAYVADPKKGMPYYELVLHRKAGDLPVVLGSETGRIGTVGGVAIQSESSSPERAIVAGGKTIKLGPARAGFVAKSHEQIVEEAMTGPIACTYDGAPCSLAYVATHFAKR